jgi:CO/xanthine dehydrogenase FAD-binding subunit
LESEEGEDKVGEAFLKFSPECLQKTNRAEEKKIPVSKRKVDIEDAPGLSQSQIETEAKRCFNCGCVAVNSSDIAVVLVALGAKVKIAGSKRTRTVPIEDFFSSLGNVLSEDEMVTEIQVPKTPYRSRQTYLKFRLRKSIDFPIISVASLIIVGNGVCKDARIALGAAASKPFRVAAAEKAIKGKVINEKTAEAAAEAAVKDALPLNTNKYKVHIARTLVKRALLS